jgi:hypothetical protein
VQLGSQFIVFEFHTKSEAHAQDPEVDISVEVELRTRVQFRTQDVDELTHENGVLQAQTPVLDKEATALLKRAQLRRHDIEVAFQT